MAPRVRLLPPWACGRQQTTNSAQAAEGADAFMKSTWRSPNFSLAAGYPTSMLVMCQEETRDSMARSGERALRWSGSPAAHECLTADGPCIRAGPDIHLRSQAHESCHRRL